MLALTGALLLSAAAPLELRLVVIDFVAVPEQVRAGMVLEAQRLLGPRGITLAARVGSAAEQRAPEEVAVILLTERSRGKSRKGQRLGSVQTTAGITTVWIDAPAVGGVAEASRGLQCCNPDMRRMALALGRVLTHELVHYLQPSLPHTRGGLMAARVDRVTLVDDPNPATPPEVAKRPEIRTSS